MKNLNRTKCENCKHWKSEFDDGWSYQTYHYCNKGITEQSHIDKCERYKEEYTLKDYFNDTLSGWLIVFGIVIIMLVGELIF